MKKIFTLGAAMLFASAGVFAQTINVTVEGKPVQNGDRVISYHADVEPDFDYLMLDPEVFVTVDADMTVTGKVYNKSDRTINFCGLQEQCEGVAPGEASKEPHTQALKAGVATNMLIDYNYSLSDGKFPSATNPLSLECEVEIFATENPSNKVKFTVVMAYPEGSLSVNDIISDGGLRVDNGKVIANTPVEVYDMQGRRVANENLHGIFVVKAGNKTSKLIVK